MLWLATQSSATNGQLCDDRGILAVELLSEQQRAIDLAREVKMRWPHLIIVLTSGNPGERLAHMPPGVQFMPKPWQPLNILMAAERARTSPGGR